MAINSKRNGDPDIPVIPYATPKRRLIPAWVLFLGVIIMVVALMIPVLAKVKHKRVNKPVLLQSISMSVANPTTLPALAATQPVSQHSSDR